MIGASAGKNKNQKTSGIFCEGKKSKTGIMGAESLGDEILAFCILDLPASRQVWFTCDNFPSASWKNQYGVQDKIKELTLHDCRTQLKMITQPVVVITHRPWAHKSIGQASSISHYLAAGVGWKNQRTLPFKEVSCLLPLQPVSLLKCLVHGDASIRRDVMVFHEDYLRFSELTPTIYMKQKRTIQCTLINSVGKGEIC